MIELIITDRLHRKIGVGENLHRLITMRPLIKEEIVLARKMGIRRFYLPNLTEAEYSDFFREFDSFWDQVIKPFNEDHPFWRNVVSSKMQEWESSAAYLALILHTLARRATKWSRFFVIVCSSLKEEDLCEEWGRKIGWKVYRRPYLSLPYWSRRIIQEIVNLKNFLYTFSSCFYKKLFSPKYKANGLEIDRQTLIVSLFYKDCFKNGKYRDHFFGNLHNTIRQNGNFARYLCGPLGSFREAVKKVKNCSEVSISIPYSIIPWGELIVLILTIFMRRIRFDRSNFCGMDFSRLIAWNSRRCEYSFNLDAEIYYTAVRKLCKKEHFDRLIQLYEGNVFERACIQAFRKYGSGQIVGYSHAVIFPLNLKIRLTDSEKEVRPEPEILVTTGPESKRLMAKIGKRDSTRIYSACSLRYIPVSTTKKADQTARLHILVALDGVRASVVVLDWLFENAEGLKDYCITLRAHPNVPIKRLLDQCLCDIPDNFSPSDGDLKSDIESSFCVMYRQTSVGMQALMSGVPVIHLDIDAPLPCDPIMDLKASKWVARTPGELLAALEEIHSSAEERTRAFTRIARKYARDYFAVPDEKNVMGFFAEENQ